MLKRFLIIPLLFALSIGQPAAAFDRINDATATPQRTFTEGDRVNNIPATRVRALWLNGVQEELAEVIEGQGLTLNPADNTQLAAAIADAVSDSTTAHAALTSPHSATSAATASRLMLRDAAGRAQVAAPSAAADIAIKSTVDAVQENLTALSSSLVGTVTAFAGQYVPSGYLECNGAQVSRTTYAALFAVISTTYGAGNGSTTFTLPDLRGDFIRGADRGRGVDAGRALGSWQADEFRSHNHPPASGGTSGIMTLGPGPYDFLDNDPFGPGALEATTGNSGGVETRPRNVAMMYIIKY